VISLSLPRRLSRGFVFPFYLLVFRPCFAALRSPVVCGLSFLCPAYRPQKKLASGRQGSQYNSQYNSQYSTQISQKRAISEFSTSPPPPFRGFSTARS
jgi:hypothetical protein